MTVANSSLQSATDQTLQSFDADWILSAGLFHVAASNAGAYPKSSGAFSDSFFAGTFADAQYSEAEVSATPGSEFVGLCVRASGGAGSCYFFYFNATTYYLGKYQAGFSVYASGSISTAPGDIVRLEVDSGFNLTAKKNGSTVASQSDGGEAFQSGSPGLSGFGEGSAGLLINWEGGDSGGTTYDETITESAGAGESNAAAAVANAAQAESAGAGESNAAAATLNPAVAESVLAVDDQGATTEINPSLIESAGAGDSYADDGSSTYNETITESATAGDSYATDAPANVPTGGSTRRPRRQIRPEDLDPAEFDLYWLEVGQSFAITFAAGATVELAAEQAPQFDYGLGWEAGAEVGLEFLQRAPLIEFSATAQPLRAKAAPVHQRLPVARVRLSMEQEPGELEIELA